MNVMSTRGPASSKRSEHRSLSNQEVGMLVALATFGMLFGTFFLTYLLARERFPTWPPPGVEPLRPLLPTLSTAVLVASSLLIHRAQQLFYLGDTARFKKFWTGGAILGFVFLGIQCAFWAQMQALGVFASGSTLFGAIFYTLTGLHAIHVLGGLIALGWVMIKIYRKKLAGPDTNGQVVSEAPRLAAWFWHFLDVVWVLMFVLLVYY